MNIAEKFQFIESSKEKANQLSPRTNWNDEFLRKVKFDFTYTSNKVEGNSLNYGQTIKLLRDFVTPKNASSGEVLDMINHQKILDNVFSSYQSQVISEENIRSVHYELMKNFDQWSDDGLYSPGQYKRFENMTIRSTGKVHRYLPPDQVSKAMAELIKFINELLAAKNISSQDKHPLTIVTLFHQRFLNIIHPFSDGNGRVARIFMNLILLKNEYPPIFIKEISKDEYLMRFEVSDNDMNPMLEFMADRLIESLQEKLAFIQNIISKNS